MLLGRTGVGKSTLGNQLFGDKMSFAVGHKSTSKTEKILWTSDHYLGISGFFLDSSELPNLGFGRYKLQFLLRER